jgi:hypothetical protein
MPRFALSALICLSALGYAAGAMADRAFPPHAQRGEMKAFAYPHMKIGDKTLRMAAGGRIYNEQNMIIMPASLQKQTAQIVYTVDINGQLGAVWLLTPEEVKKYPLKPTTKPDDRQVDSTEGRK